MSNSAERSGYESSIDGDATLGDFLALNWIGANQRGGPSFEKH